MNDKEMVFRLRKRVFDEWRYKRLSWREVKEKYGFSKRWFYKWLGRFLKYGDEGLRDRPRKRPILPHALGWEKKLDILDYVYDNPTHGPDRIAMESGLGICAKTVWNVLKEENLNTRRRRRLWAEEQGKLTLSAKEKAYLAARGKHIESQVPGELVSIDTFTVSVKRLGRIWQWTACDTYSSYGWAKVYMDKISENTVDFLEHRLLNNVPKGKIRRILTDQGVEFYSAKYRRHLECLEEVCKRHNIIHTVTKVAHPWTNGYAERLNQTIWQEFYLCRLSHTFTSIRSLQKELNEFMRYYNFKRRHTGYKLREAGYRYPAHAFFDLREASNIVEAKC